MSYAAVAIICLSLGACIGFVVLAILVGGKDSAAPSLPGAGGSRAGFDILPCPSLSASAPPLASSPRSRAPSVAMLAAMGRGMNDFKCAESVEVVIDRDRVWVNVDGVNAFRAYGVKEIQVDDRRIVDAETNSLS